MCVPIRAAHTPHSLSFDTKAQHKASQALLFFWQSEFFFMAGQPRIVTNPHSKFSESSWHALQWSNLIKVLCTCSLLMTSTVEGLLVTRFFLLYEAADKVRCCTTTLQCWISWCLEWWCVTSWAAKKMGQIINSERGCVCLAHFCTVLWWKLNDLSWPSQWCCIKDRWAQINPGWLCSECICSWDHWLLLLLDFWKTFSVWRRKMHCAYCFHNQSQAKNQQFCGWVTFLPNLGFCAM